MKPCVSVAGCLHCLLYTVPTLNSKDYSLFGPTVPLLWVWVESLEFETVELLALFVSHFH